MDRGQKVAEGKTRGQEVSGCDKKQVVAKGPKQQSNTPSSSTSCSGRSRCPVCISEFCPQCGLTVGPQEAA